jgi:hypothetical protein
MQASTSRLIPARRLVPTSWHHDIWHLTSHPGLSWHICYPGPPGLIQTLSQYPDIDLSPTSRRIPTYQRIRLIPTYPDLSPTYPDITVSRTSWHPDLSWLILTYPDILENKSTYPDLSDLSRLIPVSDPSDLSWLITTSWLITSWHLTYLTLSWHWLILWTYTGFCQTYQTYPTYPDIDIDLSDLHPDLSDLSWLIWRILTILTYLGNIWLIWLIWLILTYPGPIRTYPDLSRPIRLIPTYPDLSRLIRLIPTYPTYRLYPGLSWLILTYLETSVWLIWLSDLSGPIPDLSTYPAYHELIPDLSWLIWLILTYFLIYPDRWLIWLILTYPDLSGLSSLSDLSTYPDLSDVWLVSGLSRLILTCQDMGLIRTYPDLSDLSRIYLWHLDLSHYPDLIRHPGLLTYPDLYPTYRPSRLIWNVRAIDLSNYPDLSRLVWHWLIDLSDIRLIPTYPGLSRYPDLSWLILTSWLIWLSWPILLSQYTTYHDLWAYLTYPDIRLIRLVGLILTYPRPRLNRRIWHLDIFGTWSILTHPDILTSHRTYPRLNPDILGSSQACRLIRLIPTYPVSRLNRYLLSRASWLIWHPDLSRHHQACDLSGISEASQLVPTYPDDLIPTYPTSRLIDIPTCHDLSDLSWLILTYPDLSAYRLILLSWLIWLILAYQDRYMRTK